MKRRAFLLSLAVVLLALVPVRAADDGRRGEWSNIYVFGDSLSDNGNFVKILGPIEQYLSPFHYWQGRFSNGPVWAEYLARQLHANLLDFAVGSATTGDTTHGYFYPYVPTVLDQIRSFKNSRVHIPADSLFIVQGGGNDFMVTPVEDLPTVPGSAVANIMTGLSILKQAGARHFLVLNLPDMGAGPGSRLNGSDYCAYVSWLSVMYNQALSDAVSDFAAANHDITISVVDIFGSSNAVFAMPQKWGFTNVTDVSPNAVVPYQFGSDYFFWETIHPTTKAHQAWAGFVEKAVDRLERRDRHER